MTSTSSSTIHQNVVPSEVGWQFVPQYYTFVNKEPNRLHCFYTKTSTFIHGTEGEDVQPCFGQQEIHNKITSIGFKDCKVFIHSVDAQSSANGGIIIQVIGEMSNAGADWRKFVQTFFLAEQPNGYFVLNDIFRFLKEETVEEDVVEDTDAPFSAPENAAAPEAAAVPSFYDAEATLEPEPSQAPPREPTPPPAIPAAEEPVTVAPEPASPPTVPEPKLNGSAEPAPEPTPAPADEPPAPAQPEPAPAPAAAPPSSAPSPAPSSSAPPPAAAPPYAAVPAPTPVSTTPKTWASLAASNPKKWGPQVAQESRGLSETVLATSSSPAPSSGTQTPTRGAAPQRGGHQGQQGGGGAGGAAAVQSLTTSQCFIKGVVDPVTQQQLTQTLTQRFGPVKDVEIIRNKACAFLEFLSLDAAKRAIQVSLPQSQGGEGGVRVDVGGGETVRIVIETRKERSERPPARGRGGPPPNGEMRGGFRGRGGPGRGRGGPPPGK